MEKQTIIDNGQHLITKFRYLKEESTSFIYSVMKELKKIMVYDKFDEMGIFDDAEEAHEKITNFSPIITICDYDVEDCYIVGLEYDNISDTLFVYVTNENDTRTTKAVTFFDVFPDSFLSVVDFIVNMQKEIR